MNSKNQTKIQVRISKEERFFLEKSAHQCGFKTISEFMRVSALEKAKRDLKDFPDSTFEPYQTPVKPLKLSATDSKILVDNLLNPKEPTALLKELFAKDNQEILKDLEVKILNNNKNRAE